MASVDEKLDRIEERLDRIEKKLEPLEKHDLMFQGGWKACIMACSVLEVLHMLGVL
jgi:hypothetical protein